MKSYRVLFKGKIKEGFQEELIKDIFSKRFSIKDSKQINKVFSGGRVEIKAGLKAEEAERLVASLSEMGLISEIDPPLKGRDESLSTVFKTLPNSEDTDPEKAGLSTGFETLPDVDTENPEDETLATIFSTLPDKQLEESLSTLFTKLPDAEAEQDAMDLAGLSLDDFKTTKDKRST